MSEENGAIEFLASIPAKANAISLDGEAHGGGRLVLDVPGTDLAPLLRLTTVRGHVLHVTIAPQQGQLTLNNDPDPGEGEIPAGDGKSEALFGETPATTSPSGPTLPVEGAVGTDGTTLPDHVHRFQDGVCVECGEPREPIPAPAAAVRARRVSRGLITRGRKKARR